VADKVIEVQTIALVTAFRSYCDEVFIAYASAIFGMVMSRQQMVALAADPSRTLSVGSKLPGTTDKYIPSINIGNFLNWSTQDGIFTNLLYQSLVTTIFSQWDEHYRTQIAKLNGCEQLQVRWDVMGDARLVRNAIVHSKGIITEKDVKKLKCLDWNLKAGPIFITGSMAKRLIEQLQTSSPVIANS
jgi:hypothetical protein